MQKFRPVPRRPPAAPVAGVAGWLRQNLFSSVGNTLLTALSLWVLWLLLPPLINWTLIDAVYRGDNRDNCLLPATGLCWPYVRAKLPLWVYGQYPPSEQWRANLWFLILAATAAWILSPRIKFKKAAAVFLLAIFPPLSFVILHGGVFGLHTVETSRWGGFMLTLIVALTGNVLSLPLGILLALGRQARNLPMLRWLSVLDIELWRAVPLITVLFMASVMLPLFLPEGVNFDKLLRALIGVTLFVAAYIAEVIRGGLQAVPGGQTEAADAMGFSYWQKMRLIILPQALKISIPGLMNSFISLFKDTTLVLIVGLFDVLGMVQVTNRQAEWIAPTTPNSGYFVVALTFWVLCFGMSAYSRNLEKKLAVGK